MKIQARRSFFYFICILCLIAAAASSAVFPSRQESYPVVIEVKDGVKTITNPDYPRNGRFIAKLVQEMSCGEEGAQEAAILNKPLEIKVDERGCVYVMDMGDVNIKVYDEQGRFLRKIGRKGQGPGEFGDLAYFELLRGGRICILDCMQSRVSILTTDGKFISSFPLRGFHRNMAMDGNGRLYLGKWEAVKESDKLTTDYQEIPFVTSIYRTDSMGKDFVHLMDFFGESIMNKSSGDGGVMSISGGIAVIWNVNPQGKIFGGCNETYNLSAFGPDGKIEYAFGRKFTPLKNQNFKGRAWQKKTLPAFSKAIVFDEEGNSWIELTKDEDAKGFLFDVFSPDGIYLKQVRSEQRIAQFRNGKIYCIVRPEDGYPSIKRFLMELVPAAE